MTRPEDNLRPARGILLGLFLSGLIWAFLLLTLTSCAPYTGTRDDILDHLAIRDMAFHPGGVLP